MSHTNSSNLAAKLSLGIYTLNDLEMTEAEGFLLEMPRWSPEVDRPRVDQEVDSVDR